MLYEFINLIEVFINTSVFKRFRRFGSATCFGSKWVSNPDSYSVVFDKRSVKKEIKYVLDNWFLLIWTKSVSAGNRYTNGCAPYMTNLFILYHEDKWIWKTKRKDLNQARKFSYMSRFIDDLAAINDCIEVEKVYHETYPPESEL